MKEASREPAPPPDRPRWVKVLAAIAVLVLVAVAVMAIIGGEHGPGRHLPGGDGEQHTAPQHEPPPGGH